MCVIIVKHEKTQIPSIDIIRRAMAANPHGFGLVYAKDGELHSLRTLDADEMERFYLENYNTLKDCPFVFHARLATHGSKSVKNCHGWQTKTAAGNTAFFHNGILPIDSRGDMTDSETFLRDIFEPVYSHSPKAAEIVIKSIIGGSKFAFISEKGKIKTYGHYIERGGVLYSNLNFDYTRYNFADDLPGFYGRYRRAH